jgi:hypothetical protein
VKFYDSKPDANTTPNYSKDKLETWEKTADNVDAFLAVVAEVSKPQPSISFYSSAAKK